MYIATLPDGTRRITYGDHELEAVERILKRWGQFPDKLEVPVWYTGD